MNVVFKLYLLAFYTLILARYSMEKAPVKPFCAYGVKIHIFFLLIFIYSSSVWFGLFGFMAYQPL